MALIYCNECDKQTENADSCPHCGLSIYNEKNSIKTLWMLAILLIATICICIILYSDFSEDATFPNKTMNGSIYAANG